MNLVILHCFLHRQAAILFLVSQTTGKWRQATTKSRLTTTVERRRGPRHLFLTALITKSIILTLCSLPDQKTNPNHKTNLKTNPNPKNLTNTKPKRRKNERPNDVTSVWKMETSIYHNKSCNKYYATSIIMLDIITFSKLGFPVFQIPCLINTGGSDPLGFSNRLY